MVPDVPLSGASVAHWGRVGQELAHPRPGGRLSRTPPVPSGMLRAPDPLGVPSTVAALPIRRERVSLGPRIVPGLHRRKVAGEVAMDGACQ